MDNTLKVLGDTVRRVRDARNNLRDAEAIQAKLVLAHADELIDRGIVSIRIKEGVLFRQMEQEMGKQETLRVLGG